MDIRDMVDYSTKCLGLLQTFLTDNPSAWDASFDTLSAYNTIGKIVTHCVGAEERWLVGRVLEEPLVGRYEDRAPTSIADVFTDWRALHARFDEAFLQDLGKVVEYELPNWQVTGSMTKEAMLVHLIIHEASHRGAIMMALQRMGIDPPNFDWPIVEGTPLSG